MRSGNSLGRIRATRLLAVLPVLLVALVNTGYQYQLGLDANSGFGVLDILLSGLAHVAPPLGIAILAGGIWERIFSEKRGRKLDTGFLYTAVVVVFLMPPEVSLIHIALGMSFAIVFGNAVFGGEGKTFLCPALVGVAIMQISFPGAIVDQAPWTSINGYAGTTLFAEFHLDGSDALAWSGVDLWGAVLGSTQGLMGTTSLLAIAVGGIVLMRGGIASWRIMAGVVAGTIVATLVCNQFGGGLLEMSWYWHISLGSLALGTVFIATDPASSSSTNSGRWIQGLLTGALVVGMRIANPSHPDGVIPVLLLVSMLAPLIDHGVIWLNIRRRARRHA
jgi:Na+-transporting NADH:ubiquinone oxidoreductase subunit B